MLVGTGSLSSGDSGSIKKISSAKLTDSLSLGYYSDFIAVEAGNDGFPVIGIRNFLTFVSSYFFYLERNKKAQFPIEIDYGTSHDCFFIQCHARGEQISLETIELGFGDLSQESAI